MPIYVSNFEGFGPKNKSLRSQSKDRWFLVVMSAKPDTRRVVLNTVPDPDVGRLLSKNRYHPLSNMVQRWSMVNVKAGELVINTGRSTSVTVGRLTGSRDVIIQAPPIPTKHTAWDIEPFSRNRPFLLPGDSGAWAIDMLGNWVGLLFAGSQGSGMMLSVDHLVKDIEDTTLGTLCLPSDPEVKPWHDLTSHRISNAKAGIWVKSRRTHSYTTGSAPMQNFLGSCQGLFPPSLLSIIILFGVTFSSFFSTLSLHNLN